MGVCLFFECYHKCIHVSFMINTNRFVHSLQPMIDDSMSVLILALILSFIVLLMALEISGCAVSTSIWRFHCYSDSFVWEKYSMFSSFAVKICLLFLVSCRYPCFSVMTVSTHWKAPQLSMQPSSCLLFIRYIENQGGLENITEMDLAHYRELRNL